MSDNAPSLASAKSLAKKKVLGVPVLYLVGGGVAILTVYAWKAKPDAEPAKEEAKDAGEYVSSDELFPAMPEGTVIVAPTIPDKVDDGGNTSIDSNEEWLKRATALLVKDGVSGGQAQLALQNYLSGGQLSFKDGSLRDRAIRELGLPPDPNPVGGTDPETAALPPAPPAPVDTYLSSAQAAYRQFLGREASTDEVTNIRSIGVTEDKLVPYVSGSPEANDRRYRDAIRGYYSQYLGRNPSDAEVNAFLPTARSQGLGAVEDAVRYSPEAAARRG